jgi:hypothetical protein
VVWFDGDSVKVGNRAGTGQPAFLQEFAFDRDNQTVGEVTGTAISMPDTPVRLVEYSFDPNSFSGSVYGIYSNTILDFSSVKKPMETYVLAEEEAIEKPDATAVSNGNGRFQGLNRMLLKDFNDEGEIELSVGTNRELFVAPSYLVFPDQTRIVQPEGPFVQLIFLAGKAGEGNPMPADSVLVVTRNGTEVTRASFDHASKFTIGLKRVRRSNDVIVWRVENKAGKISNVAALGFPVRGAVPSLVSYSIQVDKHPSNLMLF